MEQYIAIKLCTIQNNGIFVGSYNKVEIIDNEKTYLCFMDPERINIIFKHEKNFYDFKNNLENKCISMNLIREKKYFDKAVYEYKYYIIVKDFLGKYTNLSIDINIYKNGMARPVINKEIKKDRKSCIILNEIIDENNLFKVTKIPDIYGH